jgi:hypothetical protein
MGAVVGLVAATRLTAEVEEVPRGGSVEVGEDQEQVAGAWADVEILTEPRQRRRQTDWAVEGTAPWKESFGLVVEPEPRWQMALKWKSLRQGFEVLTNPRPGHRGEAAMQLHVLQAGVDLTEHLWETIRWVSIS